MSRSNDNVVGVFAVVLMAAVGLFLIAGWWLMILWGALAGHHDWSTIGYNESLLWILFVGAVGGAFNSSNKVGS